MPSENYQDAAVQVDRVAQLMLAELREQSLWLKFLGTQAILPILEEVLETPKQRKIYELSDGRRSVRDIARSAEVGVGTVSRLWNQWAELGLAAESPEVPGRWRHLVSLSTSLGSRSERGR
jgi:hypothetical protein